ncbi:MAG: acetoacetate decarboxylase family protein [Alphaproteobacteria bacterium]|nr:acetoacetate decarboxylase family protein [Alphaproteobacteria bacterium]
MTTPLWTPGRRLVLGGLATLPLMRFGGSAFAQAPDAPPPGRIPTFAGEVEARMRKWNKSGFTADSGGNYRIMVGLTYRTDPDRVRRMTPPFLQADPEPLVQYNAYNALIPPANIGVLNCGPDYTEVDLSFTCYYQGLRWWTSLPWILPRDFGRFRGRENGMIRKKDGDVFVDADDGVIRSHTVRRGYRMLELETAWLDEPAHPQYWFREIGNGDLRFDIHPDPDWRKGVIGDQPAYVARHRGSDQGWAIDFPKRPLDKAPRALDLKRTRFSVGEPSPYDAFSELPVVELVGGSVHLQPFDTNAVPVPRERGPGVERIQPYRVVLGEVSAEDAAPFGFWGRAYDPPIFQGRALTPTGWPKQGSMVSLSKENVDRWRDRKSFDAALESALIIDMEAPATYRAMLPPNTTPSATPSIRLIAAKLGVNDLSPMGYAENWLFASARFDGEDVWYALAHIVEANGDVITAREMWGWPTKMADAVATTQSGGALDVSVTRLHRQVMRVEAPLKGRSGGAIREQMTVLGVQLTGSALTAYNNRYISQAWSLDLKEVETLDARAVKITFPADYSPAKIGRSDAWHVFQGAKIVSARHAKGDVRRGPGIVRSGDLRPGILPFMAERNDGGEKQVNTSFAVVA